MKIVVDTHALIWFIEKAPQLSALAKKTLVNTKNQLIIPSIVLAELYSYLRKKKRLEKYIEYFELMKSDDRISFADFKADLVSMIPASLEIHDGIIAATCLYNKGSLLLTKDKQLRKWSPQLTLWS